LYIIHILPTYASSVQMRNEYVIVQIEF
jgi:hypothetical protein